MTGRVARENPELKEKLKEAIRMIFNGKMDIPAYCLTARLMLISKTES